MSSLAPHSPEIPALGIGTWRMLGRRGPGLGPDDTLYIGVPSRGVLNSPRVTGMGYWSVNPYIGCEFGCSYCYARDTHRWTVERTSNRRGAIAIAREAATLSSADAFERRVLVKETAARVLMHALDPVRIGSDAIVIGTATDPYQPAERRFGITRAILETFRRWSGLRIAIITKSALIVRDLELLGDLSKRHEVSVNISLGSVDAKLLRRIEPRSPSPRVRLRALRALVDSGIDAGLLAAPILPGITDGRRQLGDLLTDAAAHGARWAGCQPLRLGSATRSTLMPWLERERPDLAERYRRHYGLGQLVRRDYDAELRHRFAVARALSGIPAERARRPVPGTQIEFDGMS